MTVEIPEVALEEFELPEEKQDDIVDESGGAVKFAYLCAGQAGGRIGFSFYELGYKKVIAVNTAQKDLNALALPDNQKIHMNVGNAEGAGKSPEVGENAAQKAQATIYDAMKNVFGQVDRIIVCAGLGGGTGTGSVLVLLDLARKYLASIGCPDPRTHAGAIVTLPTSGEAASQTVDNNAVMAATRLAELAEAKELSPLIFVDNDKIQRVYPQLTVQQFWPVVNSTISALFHTFNVIPTQETNYTTFDKADYSSLLSLGGCAIMGVTNVKNFQDETSISSALKNNLTKTLLADGFDLSSAKGAACIVVGGTKLFAEVPGMMNAIEYGFGALATLCPASLTHRGVYETEKQKLSAYTLITGLTSPKDRINRIRKVQDTGSVTSFYKK